MSELTFHNVYKSGQGCLHRAVTNCNDSHPIHILPTHFDINGIRHLLHSISHTNKRSKLCRPDHIVPRTNILDCHDDVGQHDSVRSRYHYGLFC